MEVKIKNNEKMIDATIEVIDGVMVVSPVKFEPKEGDVVVAENECGNNEIQMFLVKSVCTNGDINCYFGWNFADNKPFPTNCCWSFDRLATERERQRLFDKLAEEGYEWDANERKLVELKFKPNEGEFYYRPTLSFAKFEADLDTWLNSYVDDAYYKKGWVFKEQTDCENFCLKLNEAINQVKS